MTLTRITNTIFNFHVANTYAYTFRHLHHASGHGPAFAGAAMRCVLRVGFAGGGSSGRGGAEAKATRENDGRQATRRVR